MSSSRPDEGGQNSSWRPPGNLESRKAFVGGRLGRLPWVFVLFASTALADSMHEGES